MEKELICSSSISSAYANFIETIANERKYSRMNQVKFAEDSF